MMRRFHKMHGLGNDFVVFDARDVALPMTASRARAIADRRTGIGCDQLIVLEASDTATARMRIWNPDGGEVGACGNASRAVARLIGTGTLDTDGGTVTITPDGEGATADLPAPRFDWDAIPLAYAMDTDALPVAWDGLAAPMAINVGNPHAVFFVDDASGLDLATIGPEIERDPLFPDRVNVNVATIRPDGGVTLRTWERGTGLTPACGTGACATAVCAIRSRRAASPVRIDMPGGAVTVAWDGGTIRMSGPATHVFTGDIDLDTLPA